MEICEADFGAATDSSEVLLVELSTEPASEASFDSVFSTFVVFFFDAFVLLIF